MAQSNLVNWKGEQFNGEREEEANPLLSVGNRAAAFYRVPEFLTTVDFQKLAYLDQSLREGDKNRIAYVSARTGTTLQRALYHWTNDAGATVAAQFEQAKVEMGNVYQEIQEKVFSFFKEKGFICSVPYEPSLNCELLYPGGDKNF